MRLFILLFILVNTGFAKKSPIQEWANSDKEIERVDILNLKFSNRAQCALDSKKPTKSAFLLVNSMGIGKAAYIYSRYRSVDSDQVVRDSIERFRYSVLTLTKNIHHKIMNGELPLLTEDLKNTKKVPQGYVEAMKSCRNDQYCDALDQYIESLWEISENENANRSALFKDQDNFTKRHFIRAKKLFGKKKPVRELSCHYLKKYSALQAHLYGTRPDAGVFKEIAQATYNADDNIGNCEDFNRPDSNKETLQAATYLLELRGMKNHYWNKKGFAYWHSMKLYFSWAWRNTDLLFKTAPRFAYLFKAVAIEDYVTLTPNGCFSITKPSCSGDYLAQNVVREFAKEHFKENALALDVLDSVADGPENDLLDNPIVDVNKDILDVASEKNATLWLKRFSKNLTGTRTYMKKELLKAVSHLSLITKNLPLETLQEQLEKQFYDYGSFTGRKVRPTKTPDPQVQNELYYLCSEFNFINHENFSFIRENLKILKETTLVDGIAGQIHDFETKKTFEYYEKLADLVTKSCEDMNQLAIWNDDFNLDYTGYRNWYTQKILKGEVESKTDQKIKEYLSKNDPLLAYNKYKRQYDNNDVICAHASDCARRIGQSVIQLYNVVQYAQTFWNFQEKIKSPSLFNPYAERTACKVYDPWYKTKATFYGLLADLAGAALSVTTPGVIYTRSFLTPGKVTSFKKMVRDGEIVFDSKYQKSKIQMALAADFGPLTGVPCTVAISRSSQNIYNQLYRFSGISVGACKNKEDHNLNVRTASNIENDENFKSGCFSCQLNFETVSETMTHFAANVGPSFFLIRAFYRLYKALKDPHNFPRSWTTNPNHTLDTLRRFGDIPKKCERRLRKGLPCLSNRCEEAVVRAVDYTIDGTIEGMTRVVSGSNVRVKMSTCEEEIRVRTGDSRGRCVAKISKVPQQCSDIFKESN